MTIGERLKNLRTTHNYTVNSIAAFLDLSPTEVQALENNTKKLMVSQLERLCDLYNVDEDYIVKGIPANNHIHYYDLPTNDINTVYQINRVIRNIEFISSLNNNL